MKMKEIVKSKIHPSFKLVNYFYPHKSKLKLTMDRWPHGSKRVVRAVYLLVLDGVVIKVGQSIDFFRRMNDYKYAIGYSCKKLTPILSEFLKQKDTRIEIYVRFYDEELYRIDEWGEKVTQTDCVVSAEKKWKEYYKDTILLP